MSRFNNPQAQPQARPLQGQAQGQPSPYDQDPQAWPPTGGRAAQRPPQQQPAPPQGFAARPAQPAPYGQPPQPAFGQQTYAQPGYSEPSSLDPFAALRTDQPHDAFQYPQQHDAFANGQYALPQQQQPALSTYQPRPAPPAGQSFDPFAQPAPAYTPPGAYSAGHTNSFDAPNAFDTWSTPAQQPNVDTRDYGAVSFGSPQPSQGYESYQQPAPRAAQPAAGGSSHWVGQDHYAQLGMEPSFDGATTYGQPVQAQAQAQGTFEQTYADDDEANYTDAPRRGWTRVAVLLASTILLGGGLAYAYSALLGGGPSGTPPVVKSADGPFKVKPSDPGGKQFAHTDSKVMGRLGDGSAPVTETSSTSASSDVDASGARKVPVLVVSRDGTIQPPAAPSDEPPQQRATVSVPGLTVVDAFGGAGQRPKPSTVVTSAPAAAPQAPERPVVVAPPVAPVKPKVIAAAAPTTLNDSIVADSEPAPPKKPKKTTVAAVAPPSGVAGPTPTGAGYVAVLASVPASASSRIDALKQFADMQQKYGTILQNKTPDVQEANLGEKGTYHRLLVGPPGSRDTANQLCSDLKGQGYSNCWVTAY